MQLSTVPSVDTRNTQSPFYFSVFTQMIAYYTLFWAFLYVERFFKLFIATQCSTVWIDCNFKFPINGQFNFVFCHYKQGHNENFINTLLHPFPNIAPDKAPDAGFLCRFGMIDYCKISSLGLYQFTLQPTLYWNICFLTASECIMKLPDFNWLKKCFSV